MRPHLAEGVDECALVLQEEETDRDKETATEIIAS